MMALHLLTAVLALYQLQYPFPSFKTYHFREIIYAYLYIRVALRYSIPPAWLFRLVVCFLVLSVFIAIHTWYVAGSSIAVAGFTRFVHVALLAPLVALMITRESQLRSLVYTWMTVVLLGALTIFYQLLGFDLKWLLGEYLAMRGGLLRYKSLIGEPNVGGLAGVIFFVLSCGYLRNDAVRLACIGVAVFLVTFSLSKSALILFGGSVLILILTAVWKWFKFSDYIFVRKVFVSQCGVFAWLAVICAFPVGCKYLSTQIGAIFGTDEESPSAKVDLMTRMQVDNWSTFGSGGFDLSGWMHFIFGRSYALAGSAAVDLGFPKAFLPHNMYLELFCVGGMLLLGVFCSMAFVTIFILGRRLLFHDDLSGALLIPFCIVVLYMLGYPNIYETTSGIVLWLAIAVACRRLLPESDESFSEASG